MNIVFYRPYAEIWFKNPTRRILSRQRLPNKYEEFFDYLTSQNMVSVSTSLNFNSGVAGKYELLKDSLRLIIWAVLNRINPLAVRFVFTRRQFEKADAVVFMHYGNFTGESRALAEEGAVLAKLFADCRPLKVVHLTHYMYNPTVGSQNLLTLKPDLLVAENDLAHYSPYFQTFFSKLSAPLLLLPFVPGKRFRKQKPLADRIHKLGVTGSITYKMRDTEFIDYYGHDELQPMRRKIYERREQLQALVDCLIFDLDEARRLEAEAASPEEVRKAKDEAMARQRSYYKTDIVEFFNRYTMFAVPEEVCDLPGIGFIEGMACGTAYFGLDDPMYRELGMEPGVHYVAYDGSIDGLVEKVSYYQSHREELEAIAERGYRFVRERMNPEAVYSRFLEHLSNLQRVA
jgi:hypothetical protein